jgi:hypothetical protein
MKHQIEVLDSLHPFLKGKVVEILNKNNISLTKIGMCGNGGNFDRAKISAVEIMASVGIPFEYIRYVLNGIPVKHDNNELGKEWNWSSLYDGAMLEYAIKFADKWIKGIPFYEVGLKYPVFNVKNFIKKFKLELIGTFETEWSKKELEGERKIFYEVWQDKDKNFTFSFEKNRMGKGGYAGLVTKTFNQSIEFCKWYLAHKSYYVKDINLIFNGLGGFGIDELISMKVI